MPDLSQISLDEFKHELKTGRLLPTPIKFIDIPEISENIVENLTSLGITNTEALFPFIKDINSRKEFKNTSRFSNEEIQWLTKIVDVSRIKWVGPKLAALIVQTKYDTVEKLANARPAEVLKELNDAKNTHKNYQGALGINDIDSWIRQVVNKTPIVIEY